MSTTALYSDQIVKWSEVKPGDEVIWEGRLRLVRNAYRHLFFGKHEYMHLEDSDGEECLFPPGELTAVRRAVYQKPEGFTPGEISDLAPLLAADAGHEECVNGAHYDAVTQRILCGCSEALYTLRLVAA